MGGQHVVETISGREVRQGTKMIGVALVLKIDGVRMSRQIFDGITKGLANQMGGKVSNTTILGTRVAMVTGKVGTFGMYAFHDTVVIVLGIKPADTKPILTSVIKANK